ncbi:MAG: hypothetical protein WA510_20660 [Acidobacteriaceae bacterium]
MKEREPGRSADTGQRTDARWQTADIVIGGLLVVLMLGGFAM